MTLVWAAVTGLAAAMAAILVVEAVTDEPVGLVWGLAAWAASLGPNYMLLRGLMPSWRGD